MLISCPECKKQISSSTQSCPQCGYLLTSEIIDKIIQQEKLQNVMWTCFAVVAGTIILSTIVFANIEGAKKDAIEKQELKNIQEQTLKSMTQEEQEAFHRRQSIEKYFNSDGSHIALTQFIKVNMNNPDSYEHNRTTYVYVEDGEYLLVKTTFRGTNKFGGIVMNQIIAKVGMYGGIIEILYHGE